MSKEKTIFEKAKYNYLFKIFELEKARRNSLERKSQFLLSFSSIFLAGFLLNIDFLDFIDNLLTSKGNEILSVFTYIILIVIGLSLLISLIGALLSMNVRYYSEGYPKHPIKKLYDPESSFFIENSEISFYISIGMLLVKGIEDNNLNNSKKGMWINTSTISLFLSLFSIISLIFIISILISR